MKVEVFPWFSLGMSNTSIADKIKLSFENKEKEMNEELKLNFAGVSDEDGFDFAGLPGWSRHQMLVHLRVS